MATDLKVLIAGDETLLNRAIARAEGNLTKFTAMVGAQAEEQAKAYQSVGEASGWASAEAEKYATLQETSVRRASASLSTLASHSTAWKNVGDSTISAGRKISSVGSSILNVVGPLDLVGAAAGKMAIDFNKSMEQLHTQADYSQKDVEKLEVAVLKLAPKVGKSPKELAEGLYHVASAGFPAAQAMEIVKEAAIGAAVGGSSLNETTYALVSLMKSAPRDIKSASDAMGLMNAVVGQGDLHMQDLVAALSTGIVPAAKAAGLGFKDVGAALDVMTARGMPAEMSATRLRMTIGLMANPSKVAVESLEKIGLSQDSLADEMQKPNGLLHAVEDLKDHLESAYPISKATALTHEQQAAALSQYRVQLEGAGVSGKKLTEDTEAYAKALEKGGSAAVQQEQIVGDAFGRSRSSATILTLLENLTSLREQYKKLPDDQKSVERLGEAWTATEKTPAQKLAEDTQEVNVALIEMGKEILPDVLPVVKDIAQDVGGLARDFEHLSPGVKKAIIDFALVGTAIGLAAKPIGALVTGVGGVAKGIGLIEGATGKIAGKIAPALDETVSIAGTAGTEAGAAYGTAFAVAAEKGIAEVSASEKMTAASGGVAYDVAGYGSTKVPGFGAPVGGGYAMLTPAPGRGPLDEGVLREDIMVRPDGPYAMPFWTGGGVPGIGPSLTAEQQMSAQAGMSWADGSYTYLPSEIFASANMPGIGARLAANATSFGVNALKGGMIGLTGVLGSQLAGSVVGGSTGSAIAGIGTDASLGAAIGTAIAPGLGTAVGGGLGLIAGALSHLGSTSSHAEEMADASTRRLPNFGEQATRELQTQIKNLWSTADKEIHDLSPTQVRAVASGRGAGVATTVSSQTSEEARLASQIHQQAELREGTLIGKQEAAYVSQGAVLTNLQSVIDTAKHKMAELGPAAKDGMYSAMLAMVKELESTGRLPEGAATRFIDAMHKQFAGLGTYSKEAAAATVREWELLRVGSSALHSADEFVGHILGAQKQIPVSAKTTSQEANNFFSAGEDELLNIAKHSTGERHRIAQTAYDELRGMDKSFWESQRAQATLQLGEINKTIQTLSRKGSHAFLSEYQGIVTPLKKLWEEGYVTTRDYTSKIQGIVTGELKTLGITPNAHITKINQAFGGKGSGPGETGNPFLNTLPEGVGHAGGGWIGLPGERGHDTVGIRVGKGEAVVNNDQQPFVQIGLAVSKSLGVQPYGSLGELFQHENKPHYLATGGIVAPAIGGTGGAIGQITQGALNYEAAAANRLLSRLLGTAGGAAPTGGAFSASQLGTFDGLKVAKWIIPELQYARAHGWDGRITSGYRTGPDPEAVDGLSEHALDIYPGGAVDFGGMHEAAAAANRAAFIRATAGYTGKRLLLPIGFSDDGHMSGTGHASGGFVSTAYGPPWEGIQGSGVTATGINLKDAPHEYIIAVDPSVIPLGSHVKVWPNPFGYTGDFLAGDTGGAIKGHRIDFYDWEGRAAQDAWGVREVTVTTGGSASTAASANPTAEVEALEHRLSALKRERLNLPAAAAGKAGEATRTADTAARKKIANEELTIHERLKELHPTTKLTLTAGQESHVEALVNSTAADRAERVKLGSYASGIGGALETADARWEAEPENLATAAGAHGATLRAEQTVVSDKDRKKLYQDELKSLQREAATWRKLRDFYRKLARKQHGNAKKQALDKAATYQSKLTTAQSDIKTLGGKITSTETEVIKAQTAVAAIPAEQQEADLGAYSEANTKIDQEVRAGVLTEQQGKEAKEANARRALAGGYGPLSEEGILQVKGDLKEFAEATTAATNALEAHTEALKEATKTLQEFNQASAGIEGVENSTLIKSLADMISGQIGGVGYHGRAQTPGAGTAARY